MARERHSSEDPSTRLTHAKDRQFGFRWPLALDQRLDDLVERATDAGEKTNRRELLAALLLDAAYDGEDLGRLLRRYRTSSVRDAMLVPGEGVDGDVIEFPRHKPGPRIRR